mgnify:CR=1 FL=1
MANTCITLNCPFTDVCKHYNSEVERGPRCEHYNSIVKKAYKNLDKEIMIAYNHESIAGKKKLVDDMKLRAETLSHKFWSKYTYCTGCNKIVPKDSVYVEESDGKLLTKCSSCGTIWYEREKDND